MFETADVVKVNKLIHVKRGQGEGETRWKGWPWKLLRFCIDMIIFYSSWIQFENCIMVGWSTVIIPTE
jgi:hypothetical protein